MTKPVMRLILAATLLAVVHCAKPNQPEEPAYFVKTPMPDEMAELSALYLSGEILAPQELYDRIHRDLEVIRAEYGTEYSVIQENDFGRLFIPSCIEVYVDSQSFILLESGEYTAWDSLNLRFGQNYVSMQSIAGLYSVGLGFMERRHPKRLLEMYLQLPGFLDGHICYSIFNGLDAPKTYAPRMWADTISYLFSLGNDYYVYVTSVPDHVNIAGIWRPQEDSSTPNWWREAQRNKDDLFEWMNE